MGVTQFVTIRVYLLFLILLQETVQQAQPAHQELPVRQVVQLAQVVPRVQQDQRVHKVYQVPLVKEVVEALLEQQVQ